LSGELNRVEVEIAWQEIRHSRVAWLHQLVAVRKVVVGCPVSRTLSQAVCGNCSEAVREVVKARRKRLDSQLGRVRASKGRRIER